MQEDKMKQKLSFGDEYWKPNKEDERDIWNNFPLKYFKGIRDKKIIEIGSGYGLYLYYFSKENDVTGLEIDKERVKESAKRLKDLKRKIKAVQGDARKLPFKDKEFDIVFCHGVIEHFDGSEIAIREGYRVLKNGGAAMYSVPARFSFFVPLKIIQKIIDSFFGTNLWRCGYEKSFTPWEFRKMLKNSGFKIIKFEIRKFFVAMNRVEMLKR